MQLGAGGTQRVGHRRRVGLGQGPAGGCAHGEGRLEQARLPAGGGGLGQARRAQAGAGAEGTQGTGPGGGSAVAVLGQRTLERTHHQPAHQGRIAKAHLGLGRVDVDVDQLGRQVEEQGGQRLAVVEQEVGIGRAQGLLEEPVLDRAAVDDQMLAAPVAAAEGRQGGKAGEPDPVALGLDLNRVGDELAAQDGGQPVQEPVGEQPGRGLGAKSRPAVDREREGELGPGQGQAAQRLLGGLGLGPLAAQEGQPGGHLVEQVADLDPGAGGTGGRHDRTHGPALDRKRPGLAHGGGTADQPQPCDRPDRGQGLAAKAQGGDLAAAARRRAWRCSGARPRAGARRPPCRSRRR